MFAKPDERVVLHSVTVTGLPIGRALKLERTIAGVSLTSVAQAVGVSIGHLSRIESGERTASPDLVDAIRAAVQERAAA
jgi:transcriptional regulator with XRE-family HTH domain